MTVNFWKISISDFEGKPTTLCKLSKLVWDEAKSVSREKQLEFLCNSNTDEEKIIFHKDGNKVVVSYENYRQLITPKYIGNYIESSKQRELNEKDDLATENDADDADSELPFLPEDIISRLDEGAKSAIKLAYKNSQSDLALPEHLADVEEKVESEETCAESSVERDLELLLIAVLASSSRRILFRWATVTVEEFGTMLSNAENINKNFTVNELKAVISLSNIQCSGPKRLLV